MDEKKINLLPEISIISHKNANFWFETKATIRMKENEFSFPFTTPRHYYNEQMFLEVPKTNDAYPCAGWLVGAVCKIFRHQMVAGE